MHIQFAGGAHQILVDENVGHQDYFHVVGQYLRRLCLMSLADLARLHLSRQYYHGV